MNARLADAHILVPRVGVEMSLLLLLLLLLVVVVVVVVVSDAAPASLMLWTVYRP